MAVIALRSCIGGDVSANLSGCIHAVVAGRASVRALNHSGSNVIEPGNGSLETTRYDRAGVAGRAVKNRRYMPGWLEHWHNAHKGLSVVAGSASAGDAGVIHRPDEKAGGAGVAV